MLRVGRVFFVMLFAWVLATVAPLAAYAAGSSPSAISGSSLIPTNISSSCYTLLLQLDGDSLFDQCTQPLIQATEIYANASSSNTSESSLTQSLDSLCNHQNGCDRTLVRQYIAQFWDQCADELESQNQQVMQLYDYLYIFNPFRDAICSKGTNDTYCLESLAPYMQPASNIQALQLNAIPDAGDVYSEKYWAHVMTTIPKSNVQNSAAPTLVADQVFLFLSGNSDKETLCSECTRNVLASYIGFEMSTPYALGLERSSVLQPQQDIYDSARRQCGSSFISSIGSQAGVEEFPSSALRPQPSWALIVIAAALALL